MEEILNTKTRVIADLIAAVDQVLIEFDEWEEIVEAIGIERGQDGSLNFEIKERTAIVLRNRRRALAELDAAT